ncbi:transglycosylase domain-containing protein [Zoogloea ramigera]|uniref:transglycosylase domain-containing protein n=1 Tax=Zoogloea ramigera TaxID=350 RepID=UPI003FA2E5AF
MSSPGSPPLLAARFRRIALVILMGVATTTVQATQPIPAFADVKAAARPSVAVLLARDGTPLAEKRVDPHVRRLEWVALNSFSPALKDALLAAEDKRFFEHSGVDWRAFVGSLWHNLWYDRKRGASTLSMQLAGLLDPDLALGRGGLPRRSLGQKWDQALAAQALEARWTKEQILEAYLNLAPFRGDLQGVHAAARALFGKSPTELGRAESLILAVLLRGPNARPEHVAQRACVLAERINAPAACALAQRLAANLDRQHTGPRWGLAPHAGRLLLPALHPGERLQSTLDVELQQSFTAALKRLGVAEAAGVLVDNASGEVLAYVGAPDSSQPDQVQLLRSAGNLLLPFAYGVAIERRQITAATPLEDSLGNHAPTHPDDRLWVSARSALAEGLAEPGQVVTRLAGDTLAERLRLADIELPRSGPPDLNLLQLAGLYRALASGGQWLAPHLTLVPERPQRRLLRAEAGFIVGDILALRDADGAAQPFVLRQYVPDGRETVLAAFSERYTLALWTAGGRGLPVQAAGLGQDFLRGLQRNPALPRPPAPAGVVSALVVFEPTIENARREWFIRGTETERVVVAARNPPRILYPVGGGIVDALGLAEDRGFRVHFEAARAPAGSWWRLDGERLSAGNGNGNGNSGRLAWRPVAGRHLLELMSAEGAVLDSVSFAVRGPGEEASKPADQQPHQ